jgi:hypothetical protein
MFQRRTVFCSQDNGWRNVLIKRGVEVEMT